MNKAIRIRILGRDYALRVRENDEEATREVAAFVDQRMQNFRAAHPEQPELTTAVITALTIAEELFTVKSEQKNAMNYVEEEADEINALLIEALGIAGNKDEIDDLKAESEELRM